MGGSSRPERICPVQQLRTGASVQRGPSPSVDDQSLPVHLLGLFQAHQVQHGGGDIGQAAVPQADAGPHDIEGHQVGGVGLTASSVT